jgi:hypothetical protein
VAFKAAVELACAGKLETEVGVRGGDIIRQITLSYHSWLLSQMNYGKPTWEENVGTQTRAQPSYNPPTIVTRAENFDEPPIASFDQDVQITESR